MNADEADARCDFEIDKRREREMEEAQLRYRRPPGECAYCDRNRTDSMMPSHTASRRCESGKRAHCTCDACY